MNRIAVKTCCKQGFTLIELLVVVLIIGVLAAVALPQYNKAVKKAQGREVLVAIDALDKALHSYYLEHGTCVIAGTDTSSIDIPELHHFKYLVGSPVTYDNGSFQFQGFYWDGGLCRIEMKSPEDSFSVQVSWNEGKLSATCNNSSVCGDYFNCEWEDRVGCGGYCNSRVCHIY